MDPELVKIKIKEILDSKVKFEGHFNKIVLSMKENLVESILGWVEDCRDGRAYFKQSKRFPDLLIFIFRPNDTRYRAILTKKKNSYFLVFFLDKHKYYERELEKLGI